MKIATTTALQLAVTEVDGLDPIYVTFDYPARRRGRITLACHRRAWTAEWDAPSGTLVETFLRCADHNLATRFCAAPDTVVNLDALERDAKRIVLERRRYRRITAQRARELYDEVAYGIANPYSEPSLMMSIYGGGWWADLPHMPNPEHEYLRRIIHVVQQAVRTNSWREASPPGVQP